MIASTSVFPEFICHDWPSTGIRILTGLEQEHIQDAGLGPQNWVVDYRGRIHMALETEPARCGCCMILKFPCPFCGKRHEHGWGEGHRSSHCGVENVHPWSRHGYYLLEPGQVVPT